MAEHTETAHDCMRDTDVYQVVASPGNTRADRDDLNACLADKDLTAKLPSDERLMNRPMSMNGMGSLFGAMVISRSRSTRSRR